MEFVTLNNGVKMPVLGFGTYQIAPEDTERCVREAIDIGYRSIDTAWAYFNEEGVGAAVAGCGVSREELFLTSKIWVLDGGYEKAKAAIKESLRKLRTDYLDLMLIHQPFNDYYGTWRAMEEAYKNGQIRTIGVSNFLPDRMVDFCKFVEVIPAVNQVETHVFQQQADARKVMEKYGVQIESWGPFAEGKNHFFSNPVLHIIAEKHGKTVAQTALRFLIQSGVIVIPKTTHTERMRENFNVFDFLLDDYDMEAIALLDAGKTLFEDIRLPEVAEIMTAEGPEE